jgi:hypothetical protein
LEEKKKIVTVCVAVFPHMINGNRVKFAAKGGMSGFPKRVATAQGRI